MAPATRAALVAAYRAGKRSSLTSVDSDVALERFLARRRPLDSALAWALTNAWYDGFEWDCRDAAPMFLARGIPDDATFTRGDGEWLRC